MIYLDTSALVKLVRKTGETDELLAWLNGKDNVVTSSLVRTELLREFQGDWQAQQRAAAVLVKLDQIPLTFDVLDIAGTLPQAVKSRDAIHLASAIRLRDALEVFVAYDKRLLTAADEAGLPTESPGASG